MTASAGANPQPPYRHFLDGIEHLTTPFGPGSFGQKAEAFARFFGTPKFLIGQTVVVIGWILINALQIVHSDLYPFILLNLGFSLQAAYAAPLILLAQTRQADRDKAHADADAQHREQVAHLSLERQELAERSLDLLKKLLDENTTLTKQVQALTEQIHGKLLAA